MRRNWWRRAWSDLRGRRLFKRFWPRRKPLVTKVAKRGGVVVALTYAAYLLVINLALAVAHGLPLPEEVRVSFASAWSLYPGHVQAREVHIVGKDSHVQWQLDIERVHFRMSLTDLLHRQFHASGVHATGVVMRIRRTLDAAAATPAVLAVLPPIDGSSEPPLKPAVPSPPISDADYRLWSVQVDGVDAKDVREVWFDAYRFTGEAHVTGAFGLRPMRMAWVGPVSVDVARGELRLGKETALDGLAGHLDAMVAPFDPRDAVGASVLRSVTATARTDGRVASLRFVNHYLSDPSDPRLDGGEGPVHVDVRILGGVLAAPSTVSGTLEHVLIVASEDRASARIALHAETRPERPEASLTVELTGLDVWHARAPAPILRAPRIVASGRSADLDLVGPFEDGTGSVEIPGADLPDLRLLNDYLGKDGTALHGGRAHAHGTFSASVPEHSARGKLALVSDGLVVHVADVDVHATAHANIALERFDFQSRRGDLSGTRLEARDVVLSNAPADPPWWGRVELEKATVSLAGPARLHSSFALQAKDGRPVLRQLTPTWLANMIGLDGLVGNGTITMASSLVDIDGLHVKGGNCEIHAELDKRGQSSHGVALARSGPFTVGLELHDGTTSLTLLGANDWYRRAVAARVTHASN